jgi:CheY-like chemotaxis protein
MNQELALELLESAGIEVVLAVNGQQALDILGIDKGFDGILMDCQMPVMDGYTATREIRRNPLYKEIPIIAMTANAMSGDKEKVIEAGMNDHIAKPLNVSQMFATLAQWIAPDIDAAGMAVKTVMPVVSYNDTLPDLPGIDKAAGLATTMGNTKLYTRLLVKFNSGQGDFAGLFAAAQRDSDPTAATRCAHTLKGTAGNIGAKGVQAAAGALEQACQENAAAGTIQMLLDKTVSELALVIAGLALISSNDLAPDGSSTELNLAKVQPLIKRLAAQLADIDGEASDTLQELLVLSHGTALAGGLQRVAKAVADYEFEDAEAALQAINLESIS